MEGLIKDVGSRGTGARRYWIPFGNLLRNRLGERYLIPVAPSLFAVRFFCAHSFEEFSRSIWFFAGFLLKRPHIIFFITLALVCPTGKVYAVPICDSNIDYAWYCIESSGADWDMSGYNLVGMYYPWLVCGSFNEGDNVEWIYYALENQYAFLDDTLYRITGGCYLLGPVCYPHWHGFRYYYRPRVRGREIICILEDSADITTECIDNIESVDMATLTMLYVGTGRIDSLASLRKMPGHIYPKGGHIVEAKAVPELSTFTLFGLVALQFLRFRRIGGEQKEKA